jgi:chromosome partitioning protein
VPTMYDSRLAHDREAVGILRKSFGDLVYETVIPKTIKFAEAPVKGQSVLKYAPDSQAADSYRRLAREVLDGKKI